MNFDWKAIVSTVAPTIASALGTPVAGLAVQALLPIFGITPDEPDAEGKLAAAMKSATPEQMLAMKQADQAFAVKMRELDIDLEAIAAKDRDSARNREVQSGDHWTPRLLAFIILGLFGTVVYMVLAGEVENLRDPLTAALVGTVVGYVSAKADQVVSYFFGSSSSSNRKTEAMAQAITDKGTAR